MKTSTSLLIAAGAVVAVVGVGSTVYAGGDWRDRGSGPYREHGRGWHGDARGGPDRHGAHGPRGPMHGPGHNREHGMRPGAMHGPGFLAGHGAMGGMTGPMIARHVFELADANADGDVTQEEIDAARTAHFARHDADGDGTLTLDEFGSLLAEITRPATVRAFQFLDPDGDAVITMEEFEKPDMRLVRTFDRNGDGEIRRAPERDGTGPWRPDDPRTERSQ